ncbi:MAG: M48 family metallopeptidase [Betaproteobacteria bacterium]|nr:M48 family metallopeptidase [Betaproteobacteria bacterium]
MSDSSEREELKDGVWWFDSESSRRRRAVLIFGGGFVCAKTEDGMRRDARINDLEISSRIGVAPRRIVFPDGVSLSADDNDFIDAMLKKHGGKRAASPLHFIESRWRVIAAAAAGAALLFAALVYYGVPAAAKAAAGAVPREHLTAAAEEIYGELRRRKFIAASKLAPAETARIKKIFAATAADYADSENDYRLRPHDFLPNAFALPDGLIVVSDKLLAILSEEELHAVFAHEIGHVELRHGMRSVFESAGVAAFLILATGDISGIVAGGALLANLKYSRNHEREADCFAYRHLLRRNMSGALVGDALQKMEDGYKKSAKKEKTQKPETENGATETADNKTENKPGEESQNGESENKTNKKSADADSKRGNKFWRKILETLSTHPATEARRDLASACKT